MLQFEIKEDINPENFENGRLEGEISEIQQCGVAEPGCPVCGSQHLYLDEVEPGEVNGAPDQARLFLGECQRCDYRWTSSMPAHSSRQVPWVRFTPLSLPLSLPLPRHQVHQATPRRPSPTHEHAA